MAQSRLEKVGSLYTRMQSLLKKNNIQGNNKPLWFDLYKAFPPKYEPNYDRPVLRNTLRPIFYIEDKIRMKFQKDYGRFLHFNLSSNDVSSTESFMLIYKKLENKNYSEDDRYQSAVKEFSFMNQFFYFYKKKENIQNKLEQFVDDMFQTEKNCIFKNNKQNTILIETSKHKTIEVDDRNEIKDKKKYKNKFDLKGFFENCKL